MRECTKHRKRQANKGRVDTGVLVTFSHRKVDDGYVWCGVVLKTTERHSAVDAIMHDGDGDMGTHHRNRFNPDHRVVLRVQNTVWSKALLRKVSEIGDVTVTSELGGLLCAKISSNAEEILAIIQSSRLSSMFEVVSAYCGENKTPMASTIRSLHGRR